MSVLHKTLSSLHPHSQNILSLSANISVMTLTGHIRTQTRHNVPHIRVLQQNRFWENSVLLLWCWVLFTRINYYSGESSRVKYIARKQKGRTVLRVWPYTNISLNCELLGLKLGLCVCTCSKWSVCVWSYSSRRSSPSMYLRLRRKARELRVWECLIRTYPVTLWIKPVKLSSSATMLSKQTHKHRHPQTHSCYYLFFHLSY